MDSIRIIMFLLTNMITLDFNLAQSRDSYVTSQAEGNSIRFRRFQWRDLSGKPVAGRRRHRSLDSLDAADEYDGTGQSRAVYWIPTTCDPMLERGYTCLGCGESLHCMGGGFALKAICMGRRPFCNNGICSNTRGEKCNKMEDAPLQLVDPVNANATAVHTSNIKPGVQQLSGVHAIVGLEQSGLPDVEELPEVPFTGSDLPPEPRLI